MNKSVINLLADTYGLSVDQENRLNNCTTEGLEYAVKEFARQKQTTTINNPVNWIAKVAAAYKPGSPSFPKKGNMTGHSVKQSNPGGHSPAGEQSNLTYDERREFASDQESIWDEIFEVSSNMQASGFHQGYPERVKSNWKRIGEQPQEFPTSSNAFKNNIDEASCYSEGSDYEEHLNRISADKTDPEGYKLIVRKYDYRRTARK